VCPDCLGIAVAEWFAIRSKQIVQWQRLAPLVFVGQRQNLGCVPVMASASERGWRGRELSQKSS
jgi:hypothetical protein